MRKQEENKPNIRGWFPTDPANKSVQIMPTRKASPTLNDRLVGGLGAAGGTFTFSAIIFSFISEYPKPVANLLFFVGIPLLVAAFLVRRKYKR